MAKQELLVTLRERYRSSSKKDKSRILDEFIAITGHHRKHGIRLLGQLDEADDVPRQARGQRIYDEAVREVVIMIWEAADRICGKRLKAAVQQLPSPAGINLSNWNWRATATPLPLLPSCGNCGRNTPNRSR